MLRDPKFTPSKTQDRGDADHHHSGDSPNKKGDSPAGAEGDLPASDAEATPTYTTADFERSDDSSNLFT